VDASIRVAGGRAYASERIIPRLQQRRVTELFAKLGAAHLRLADEARLLA